MQYSNLIITADARIDNREDLFSNLKIAKNSNITDSQLILHVYQKWSMDCPFYLLGDYAFVVWDGQQLFCVRDHIGTKPFYYYVDSKQFVFASDIRALLAYLPRPLDEAYAEQLRELLQQAIKARMRSAFPIGAHLSGGLDSSSIAVLAARQSQSLQAYSWSLPPQPEDCPLTDERAEIEKICAQEPNIQMHYTSLDPEEQFAIFKRDPSCEPTADLLIENTLCRNAAQHGQRTLLSGWGSDEVAAFNGRGYFAELFVKGYWHTLYQEGKQRSQAFDEYLFNVLINRIISPLLPNVIYWHWWKNLSRFPNCLIPEFRERMQQISPITKQRIRELPSVRCNQLLLLHNGHITRRLEDWAINGAMHRVVYGYPLLDRRILDFCLSIPPSQFFKKGWKRFLYRNAMTGILPVQVQWKNLNMNQL